MKVEQLCIDKPGCWHKRGIVKSLAGDAPKYENDNGIGGNIVTFKIANGSMFNVDGNTAEVTAQIEVYDYYKTQTEVSTYITNHQDEFNTNGIFDNNKVLEYKIKELTNTKDKVTYTIVFNLTKVNDTWTIDNLSEEELEKIHGTYAH